MSVIMTLTVEGDPAGVERYAAENPEAMQEIVAHAVEHGLIAHRFYGSDGQILVIDEWPDAESCNEFLSHMGPQIQPIMAAAGVTAQPHPVYWKKLDSRDDHGWGA